MKTYQVVLTKSYLITISTETKEQAKRICEFYTNDIQDVSTAKDRKRENFAIENIECTINEAFDCIEIEQYDGTYNKNNTR